MKPKPTQEKPPEEYKFFSVEKGNRGIVNVIIIKKPPVDFATLKLTPNEAIKLAGYLLAYAADEIAVE